MNPQKLCQQIADAHYAVACSPDKTIAYYKSPMYRATERAMLTAIRQVYGLTPYMARRAYDAMLSGDWNVADAVAYITPIGA
jgi:hypothetical protein